MISSDILPGASTLCGVFLAGALAGYVLEKVFKIAAIMDGLLFAVLVFSISTNS
jgi:hypothetical protein